MYFILSVSHYQLVPYWEKTFHIDLSSPQIGVVDVEDVSNLSYPLQKPKMKNWGQVVWSVPTNKIK